MKHLLDPLDIKILKLLQENSQITTKEIAEEVNLSISPTHERIKNLEEMGFIIKQVALLNRKMLNLGLMVHCQVTLEKQNRTNFNEFERAVQSFPEVTACQLISGNFDYHITVVCSDVDSYHRFYQEKLSALPSVAHINSLFVMNEVKNSTKLPI